MKSGTRLPKTATTDASSHHVLTRKVAVGGGTRQATLYRFDTGGYAVQTLYRLPAGSFYLEAPVFYEKPSSARAALDFALRV
jgi:hypothetical protein